MKLLRWSLRLTLLGSLAAAWLLSGVYLYLSPGLPDVETLRDVQLQTPMRVYTAQGDLIGQFGEQKRNPLDFSEIPDTFVRALLAAEDDGFFRHSGIDLMGLGRAVSELLLTGEKGSGGSTLTMQVARNYFLTLDQTFIRKFNEILLAIEIERRLSKQEIFELYVNRVFLGHRAYGFEAAAQVYYGKSMRDLSLAQHAMLAGIPKAPSRNNPLSSPENARERRNWILGRMRLLDYIDEPAFRAARAEAVGARYHGARISLDAQHAAEMVRQEMLDRYGVSAYTDGYEVYTTLDSRLQRAAQSSLVAGLLTYDQRHGYRGPEQQLVSPDLPLETPELPTYAIPDAWLTALGDIPTIAGLRPAVITGVDDTGARFATADGSVHDLPWENGLKQARPYINESARGRAPQAPSDVVSRGDVVRIHRADDDAWHLAQVPAAQAALVALKPGNGAILSLVGGIGYELSKFNRVTQARRQPGSNFKPFIYSAALAAGYTPASMINDAPVVLEDSSLEGIWRPENDGGKFYGPTRLRWALTKSRNLVSIRLVQQMGVRRVIDYADQLGFDTSGFSRNLSLALGTQSMSPLTVAQGYATLANGGYAVSPHLVSRIEGSAGQVLFRARPATVCDDCTAAADTENPLPEAPRVMDERVNFLINSLLQDVITRGTGRRALALKREDLAGKTGTTNGPMDAWFSGFNRDVVATSWVGFDAYMPLGRREFGGTSALPIWISYMREALRDRPERAMPVPNGITSVRIDPDSGLLASADQRDAIFEYFRDENVPTDYAEGGQSTPGKTGTDDLINDIF
ncbi:MAG: penicillin-binding protein 1A [Chromatocurvus sp.]